MNQRCLLMVCVAATALPLFAAKSSGAIDPAARRDGVVSYLSPEYPPRTPAASGGQFAFGADPIDVATDRVVLRARVRRNGTVRSVEKLPGMPSPLVKSATEAARRWRFNAADHERIVTLTFLFEGEGEPRCEFFDLHTRYESPYTLHLQAIVPRIACIPRIDGRTPEKWCPLHHVPMTVERVSIGYGLVIRTPPPIWQAYEKGSETFPNAPHTLEGGCVIGMKRFAEMYACPVCKRNAKAWEAAHPGYH